MVIKLGRQRHWQSHLLAGVPIQSRPLQDKPETLPLLGDEDAAFFSLLPQPAVTVGLAQLAARHPASAHGRCLSCKAQNVWAGKQWWLYRRQKFTEVQNKCDSASTNAEVLKHTASGAFWWTIFLRNALNNYAGDGELNHLKLLGGTLINLIIFATAATLSLAQATQWHK